MDSLRLAVSEVQPGDDDDVVADPQSVEGCSQALIDLEPGVRGALAALPGRVGARTDRRAHRADRAQLEVRSGTLRCRRDLPRVAPCILDHRASISIRGVERLLDRAR